MTIPALSTPPSAKLPHVADVLRSAFQTVRDPGAIAVVTVPAPVAPLEALLEDAPGEDALVWHPAEGPSFAAIGAIATLRGAGPDRVAEISRGAETLWSQLQTINLGDDAPPPPRCFGGFAFQPGAAGSEPWTDFGDSRFVLPRFRYARQGERAWLSVAARGSEVADGAALGTLVAAAEAYWAGLRAASLRSSAPRRRTTTRTVVERVEIAESEWRQLVQTIVDRIGKREFEKIVIARRTALSFDGAVDVLDVISELAKSSEHCTRFAFRFGRGTFLGATPERLVRRTGLELATEALAGTNRGGDAARAAEMMDSPKEREEHELVVREIVSSLSPVCATLEHPAMPEIRVLPHLLHLTTPIRGRLARPVHVLALVERLHPTPAVGGVPTREAVRFITSHEPAERGWYASPIGWFDAEGDGEFAVGLRAGAFVGSVAYLYAGGGIVRDSDPASEYAETRLKLQTLCAALHVAQ